MTELPPKKLNEETEKILEEVLEISGKPVHFKENPDHVGLFGARITIARKHMDAHIVHYTRKVLDEFDYIVAHECGHVVRMFGVEPEKRLSIGSTEIMRVEYSRKMKKEYETTQVAKMKDFIESMATQVYEGTIFRLWNFPTDAWIENWIWKEHAGLRELQKRSLREELKDVETNMTEKIRVVSPATAWRCSNITNYSYMMEIKHITGVDPDILFVRNIPELHDDARKLYSLLDFSEGGTYEQDMRNTDTAAKFLGLEDWYTWALTDT